MGFLISDNHHSTIKQFSLIPKKLLYRIIFGKESKYSSFFITENDKLKARLVSNGSFLCFLILFFL